MSSRDVWISFGPCLPGCPVSHSNNTCPQRQAMPSCILLIAATQSGVTLHACRALPCGSQRQVNLGTSELHESQHLEV